MSASPAVRSLRSAVFAVVCVLLAAAGHRLATGTVKTDDGTITGAVSEIT